MSSNKFSLEKKLFVEKILANDKKFFEAKSIEYLGKTAGMLKALFDEVIFYNACIESKYYSKKFSNFAHMYFFNEEKLVHLTSVKERLDTLISNL